MKQKDKFLKFNNMDNKEKIIEAIKSGKKTVKEMAKLLKITEKQLKLLLESWGVEFLKRAYKRVQMPDRETLMRLYEQNKTTQGVAKAMGVSLTTVARWMKERKIPMKRMAKMSKEEKLELLEYHVNSLRI